MDVSLTTIFASFILIFTVESHSIDNYIDVLFDKFSSEGHLSQDEFKSLALDVTANKLPAAYSTDCENLPTGVHCIRNTTTECLGYDDIFNKYSNDGSMDKSSLGKAVPTLLYFAQDLSCTELPAEYHKFHKKPTTGQAWAYGIGFVTLILIISNVGALLGPCMKSQIFKRLLMFCVALAVGTLAATGLLVLIPESMGLTGVDSLIPDYNWKMTTVLGGIYFVFICERLLKVVIKGKKKKTNEMNVKLTVEEKKEYGDGHSHGDPEDMETNCGGVATVAWILLAGDSIHNFVDGLSIGAAFTENVFTGISVSLAVVCEELPHELGDIAILLHSGLSMKRALLYNFLAAVVCYAGLIIGIVVGENTDANRWIFAFAGGLFIYIALVDMIPEMNEQAAMSKKNKTETTLQIFLYQNSGLLLGFLIIILISYFGKYIDV